VSPRGRTLQFGLEPQAGVGALLGQLEAEAQALLVRGVDEVSVGADEDLFDGSEQ